MQIPYCILDGTTSHIVVDDNIVRISMPFREYWKTYSSAAGARTAARKLTKKLNESEQQINTVKAWHKK